MNPLAFVFMQNAFIVGGVVAIAAGATGWFVVERRQAFASHAIAHFGFPGAAAALLLGWSVYVGLFGFAIGGALVLGVLGEKLKDRDVSVGMVLALALGLGLVFLSLYTANAGEGISILFGNIVGISRDQVWLSIGVSILVLLALIGMSRPLLFATLNPEVAAARGVPTRLINGLFLIVLAIAVAVAVPAVGALLVFALVIGPASATRLWTSRIAWGLLGSVALGLIDSVGGVLASWYIGLPASFWIVTFAFCVYLASTILAPRFRSTIP